MNELAHALERLQLSQYLENFIEEGFDTWDTVLYITESDLDALNVKLGHRRKLQREIAYARGITFDQLLAQSGAGPTAASTVLVDHSRSSSSAQGEGQTTPTAGPTKRKYRRHPKPDENAPERPPSAYVIFSNQVRDELKPQRLSFTEIAKTVGGRWQALSPEEKEPYESKANEAKDTYNREMARYKKTPQYREYMQYLADFRTKNAGMAGDGKRTRLEKEFSQASSGSAGSPIEAGYESATLPTFRPPRMPSGASGSSTSSTSPTSTVAPSGLPPGPSASPPATAPRHPHLPRIVPLEPRDGVALQSNPPALVTEPHLLAHGNLRRTTGTPTASLLRKDTSKSSISSNLSGTSNGSSGAFTPVTPIDEGPHRSTSLGMHTGPILPPLGPPVHVPSPSPSTSYSAAPMKRLSLDDDAVSERSFQRPRSNPPDSAGPPDSASLPAFSPRSPHYQPRHSQPHHHSMSTSSASDRGPLLDTDRDSTRPPSSRGRDRDRMDPLSVLALAGNMMDRRPGEGRNDYPP